MGKVKKNLLTSILLLVVMGIFAVLTIFVVVDAVNKKYYEDLNVDYEVQEEAPNIILTFARHEGSEIDNSNTKVVLNADKTKFRLDGVVPEVTDGTVTNLDAITNENGGEFYFFSTNPAFIDVQETPEDPNLIFSETDIRYYISTEENPIWYDVPTENVFTLHAVFLTPNVHNSDFANAPLNTITNAIVSHDVVNLPEDAFKGSSSSRPSALTTVLLPQNLHSVGEYAFYYCKSLTSITIPEGVRNIGRDAFFYCSSLTSITIPEGVTSIGNYAFSYCSSLTSITIPSSVASIGENVFDGCVNLQYNEWDNGLYLGNENNPYFYLVGTTSQVIQSCNINTNCKIIGSSAFEDCTGLTSITIPSSVMSIGSLAFRYCTGLTSITFEEGSKLTSIGQYAFDNCTGLTSITIPSGVTSIKYRTFYNCRSLISITIPSSVTSIESNAFYDCSSLTSITIPEEVTSIGYDAFYNCRKLVEVINLSSLNITTGSTSNGMVGHYADYIYTSLDSPLVQKEVDDYIFYFNNNIMYLLSYIGNSTNLTLPSVERVKEVFTDYVGSSYQIYDYAFNYNDNIVSITIPSTVMSIGDSAFYNCTCLTTVTFEDMTGLSKITSSVFSGCSSIETLTILSGEVKDLDFSNFTNLTTVILGERVTSIESNAFRDCRSLTSITIPESVTRIGSEAFRYCYDIQELHIDNLTSYLNISYADNYARPLYETNQSVTLYINGEAVTALKISEDIISIPDYAFRRCNFTSVTIPESVTSIGSYSFYNCTGPTTVTFEEGSKLTSIGDYAFRNCTGLTSITIPEGVTSIGSYTFSDCSSLTSITIPSGVTSIGSYAFYRCTGFTSITIPSSVTSIGSYAFRYCYRLVEVYNLSNLDIEAKSTSNGYVGYYADHIYTSLNTPLKQQSVGDYIFYLNDDIMYLLAYLGNDTNLTLPSVEEVKRVFTSYTGSNYQIYDYAFYNNDNIASITIPSSVTSIGSYAFYSCNSLTSITLPERITAIEDYTFYGCSVLTNITIPSGVTSIGVSAFNGCSSLTSITIPSGVTSIGSSAFRVCYNLTIYCEVESEPSGWNSSWNYSNCTVYFGLNVNWEYDEVTGEPRPIGER